MAQAATKRIIKRPSGTPRAISFARRRLPAPRYRATDLAAMARPALAHLRSTRPVTSIEG